MLTIVPLCFELLAESTEMPSNSIKGLSNFKIDQSNFTYKFGTPLKGNCPFGLYSPLAESMLAAFEVPELVASHLC